MAARGFLTPFLMSHQPTLAPPAARTPRYPWETSRAVEAWMWTRTLRSGSRASSSLKNSMPNSPTSSPRMAVMCFTAPSGSVRVKSGSASAPSSTRPSPVAIENRAGPASSTSATRASRASGLVAFLAAGEVSKKRDRASALGSVMLRVYSGDGPRGCGRVRREGLAAD